MTLRPETVRAARGLLGWSQDQLALQAGLCRATVAAYEQGRGHTAPESVRAMARALERARIRIVETQEFRGLLLCLPQDGDIKQSK